VAQLFSLGGSTLYENRQSSWCSMAAFCGFFGLLFLWQLLHGILLGGVSPGSESVGVASGNAFGGGHYSFGSAVAVGETGIQLSGQAIFVSQTP
jgi:hypothetical protein